MEARLRYLTSTSVICFLFFMFVPLSKWFLLAIFILLDFALYSINQKRSLPILGVFMLTLIFSSLFYPNFPMIICICLASFIFHAMKVEPGSRVIILTLLFGIHLVKSPSPTLLMILIIVYFIHLILTIIITSRNRVQLSQRMKVFMALGAGGGLVIWFMTYIASGRRNGLGIGIYGLASLLSGGLYQVFNTLEADEKEQERIDSLTSANKNMEPFDYTEYTANPYLHWIFIGVLLVIFTAVIIFIVKRRKTIQEAFMNKGMNLSMKSSRQLVKEQKKRRVVMTAPPNIPIRMLVYQF